MQVTARHLRYSSQRGCRGTTPENRKTPRLDDIQVAPRFPPRRTRDEALQEHPLCPRMGRTGVPGLFIGNTAESVLHQVDCSVLALKPPGFVSPVTC